MKPFAIAIHGGAGTILRQDLTSEMEQSYLQSLNGATEAGYRILQAGGTAMDAVTAAVVYLEDCELFNAGKGSVFTKTGTHEMDASIMNGETLEAGAVTGVKNVRNPVLLAREVMLNSGHVFLSGGGANEFAQNMGVAMEDDSYFFSEFRYRQWLALREGNEVALDHSRINEDKKFGTVGAVACDANGNIASATSTGGMTNKMFGRVGDTPVIGAGTYANNKTCAISCTGHGEMFLRAVAAYDVSALMEYKGLSLREAMYETTHVRLMSINGEGGMIGIDAQANVVMDFNSEGMYRAMKHSNGESFAAIYKN